MSSFLYCTLLFISLLLFFETSAAAVGRQRSLFRSIGEGTGLPDYAVDLNSSTFDSILKESPASFAVVEFFAHWCPACRNYKPHYEKVARLFNGPNAVHPGIIQMTRVDCAMKVNTNLCEKFSVGRYPMLLWGPPHKFTSAGWDPKQEKSEIMSIDNARTAVQLLNWINKRTESSFSLDDEKYDNESNLPWNATDPAQIARAIYDVEEATSQSFDIIIDSKRITKETRAPLIKFFQLLIAHHPSKSSDKDEADVNVDETSMLGLQSYWNASYAQDLANFQEHGHAGEVWFGAEVMATVVAWTKNLCLNMLRDQIAVVDGDDGRYASDDISKHLSGWNVLDIGTGNGLLLQELAKIGFSDLTGTDYCEGAIDLSRNLAARNGFSLIKFLVDDVLETKLDNKFHLVMDKGTLDAIGLHPDGPVKRLMYWDSVAKLVAPSGILVITSCNNTKDELLQEMENFNERRLCSDDQAQDEGSRGYLFKYIDHIRSYPSIMFGGVEGTRVSTVAFVRT